MGRDKIIERRTSHIPNKEKTPAVIHATKQADEKSRLNTEGNIVQS